MEGTGWAADLLRGATTTRPPRSTPPTASPASCAAQAEAAGWLGFLDRAGLGGCLAMDMGLGKTPTVLAHLLVDRGHGSGLVICPPAVLGNWASEANRFTELKIAVTTAPPGGGDSDLARLAARRTSCSPPTPRRSATSGPAAVAWRRVVVDEAQVIKNHQSETAQELRRLNAHSRIALTGTPVENGLGDLWAILDFTNPGLVGARNAFIEHLSRAGATALPGPGDGSRRAGAARQAASDPRRAPSGPSTAC